MRGRLLVALLLVSASFGAMIVSADISSNINDPPTGRKLSECYTCHKDGGGSYGPAMTDTYLIITPLETVIPVGEKVEFMVSVKNAWTPETDRFVAAVNLDNATGLAHAADRDDLVEEIVGEIEVPPTQGAGGTGTDFGERVTFNVEGGVTELRITLEPTHPVEDLRGQLGLRLWPSASNPEQRVDPNNEVRAGGPGQSVTYTAQGASNIVEMGVGQWVAEAFVETALVSGQPQAVTNQPFRITVEQLFQATGEPIAFGGSDEVLPDVRDNPTAQVNIPFTVTATELPEGPGTIAVTVVAREFYDHEPNVSQWDQWMFTKTIELIAIPVPEENAIKIQGSGVVAAPELVEGIAWDRIGEVIGYVSGFLIIASIYTGGMFGKATRRHLNGLFGTAKRRVAFHNFLSYGILLTALVHTFMFIFVESAFAWTKGIIWGGVAILAMIGLGVTGAMQVPMIRKWNYATWRWSHFYLAIATMLFTVVHIFLDGQNFADFQATLGYTDPFA